MTLTAKFADMDADADANARGNASGGNKMFVDLLYTAKVLDYHILESNGHVRYALTVEA